LLRIWNPDSRTVVRYYRRHSSRYIKVYTEAELKEPPSKHVIEILLICDEPPTGCLGTITHKYGIEGRSNYAITGEVRIRLYNDTARKAFESLRRFREEKIAHIRSRHRRSEEA